MAESVRNKIVLHPPDCNARCPGKLDRKIVGKALMPQYWGCVPPPTDKNYFREKPEIMGGWGVKVLNRFW